MASIPTQILNEIVSQVTTLFAGPPAIPVVLRRDSKKNPRLTNGDPFPIVIVSGNEDEKITGATANTKFVEYTFLVSYVTREIPGNRDESTVLDVQRQAQQSIHRMFDIATMANVSVVSQIDPTVLKPYDLPFADQLASCAAVRLRVETKEPRN